MPVRLAPELDLTVYGHGGNDSFTVNSISGRTSIVGGMGDDVVTVQAPSNDLTGILDRLTVDGKEEASCVACLRNALHQHENVAIGIGVDRPGTQAFLR